MTDSCPTVEGQQESALESVFSSELGHKTPYNLDTSLWAINDIPEHFESISMVAHPPLIPSVELLQSRFWSD